jgi:hypothetical protein
MSYAPGVVPKGIGNKIGPFDSTDLHSAKDKSEISEATRQAAKRVSSLLLHVIESQMSAEGTTLV